MKWIFSILRLLRAYRGLKPFPKKLFRTISKSLLRAYRGLKQTNPILINLDIDSLLRAYRGLKQAESRRHAVSFRVYYVPIGD